MVEFAELRLEALHAALRHADALALAHQLILEPLLLLVRLGVLDVLLDEGLVLLLYLLLELLDLVVHDLELSLELGDLVLRLDEVLREEVAVRANSLVQRLRNGLRVKG